MTPYTKMAQDVCFALSHRGRTPKVRKALLIEMAGVLQRCLKGDNLDPVLLDWLVHAQEYVQSEIDNPKLSPADFRDSLKARLLAL